VWILGGLGFNVCIVYKFVCGFYVHKFVYWFMFQIFCFFIWLESTSLLCVMCMRTILCVEWGVSGAGVG